MSGMYWYKCNNSYQSQHTGPNPAADYGGVVK